MKTIIFTLMFMLFQINCQNRQNAPVSLENTNSNFLSAAQNPNSTQETQEKDISDNKSETEEDVYSGVTIDQKFPVIEGHDFEEKEFKTKSYSVKAEEFQVNIRNYAPQSIGGKAAEIFKLKTQSPNDYWGTLVGVSHLLGEKSKQIYVEASGPGGVCCTNYWITDVSNGTPRNIFRSEDFGSFRDPMEVFDADGDGIYELVQFDSAFRYFMDDCGSCSPEPRAVFKYDKKRGAYFPAKGIQQDFVKESFLKTEKELAETFKKLKTKDDVGERYDFEHIGLSYIVDLFYLGEERKAWKFFDKYLGDRKTRAEIKKLLRQSEFYQALKKSTG